MRLVVVGAGITGLTAAFAWSRERPGDEVVVVEAGGRTGGKVDRVDLAGTWFDTGPEAALAVVPEVLELVGELGLAGRVVRPATTRASIVLPDGRHPLPPGTVLGVP
ncbi:MAG TPA: NAD(P)-binding protein, partial [Geodermatophilus sp.]|nr:NAD(P)-binding protein [Geodermatophilus sp.]